MPMPHPSPSPDTIVLRTGLGRRIGALFACLALVGLGLTGVVGLVMLATGTNRGEITPQGIAGMVFMLVLGALGVLFGLPIWTGRRLAVMVDRTGMWLDNGTARQVVPWDVLAGVGIYWSELGKRTKVHTFELCPSGPIDDRDPVLWAAVRDEEPIGPGLPRLRYRLPVPQGKLNEARAALQQYAPAHLWLGEVQRGAGHIGRPDTRRRPNR
ncbi:hypothetical protein AB0D04_27625 [Streptomyces sp. NPDC048483]|uniref:hypothetical protein n=1 Tax=Streptomyces sp. NPDC048483 TaxID=3154927 RepID=UPI00343FBB3E